MAEAGSRIAKIACVAAAAVCLFAAENIWIDPWLARKSHHKLPSFVPEALGGMWFLTLMALAITVILLVVSEVLLMRDVRIAAWKKTVTGILVVAAAVLTGGWVVATGGIRSNGIGFGGNAETASTQDKPKSEPQKRTVVLRWQASTTPRVRYNVYRGSSRGIYPDKLNSAPIDGTAYSDATAVSGQTYWYAVRAINSKSEESTEIETSVTVP